MGNIEKQKDQSWQKIGSIGVSQIVKDNITGILAQSYICNPQNHQYQINVYQFRTDNKKYLPKVLSICLSDLAIKVVIQRIPYRLIDLGHLGYGQGLYILQRSLRGGQIIFRKTGGIHFDDSMICFTVNGKSKIWLNQNLSKNHSQLQVKLTQKEVVLEIMTIVETRMGGQKFIQYMRQKKKSSIKDFKSAIQFIIQMKEKEVITIQGIILPNKYNLLENQNNTFKNNIQNKDKQSNTTYQNSQQEYYKHLPIEYAKKIQIRNQKIQNQKKKVIPCQFYPKRQIKRIFSHNKAISQVMPLSKQKKSLSPFINNKNCKKQQFKDSEYFHNIIPQSRNQSGNCIKTKFTNKNLSIKGNDNSGIQRVKKINAVFEKSGFNENTQDQKVEQQKDKLQNKKFLKITSQPRLKYYIPVQQVNFVIAGKQKNNKLQEKLIKKPLLVEKNMNNKIKLFNNDSQKFIK